MTEEIKTTDTMTKETFMASELVAVLKQAINAYGDRPVFIDDPNYFLINNLKFCANGDRYILFHGNLCN